MLAKEWSVCANPDCDWEIEPGEIVVEVREGVYAHQGCEAGVSNDAVEAVKSMGIDEVRAQLKSRRGEAS